MKKSQMILVVVIIVVVAAAVGYFVWQRQQDDAGAANANTNKNANSSDTGFVFDDEAGLGNTNAAESDATESADATDDEVADANVNAAAETPAEDKPAAPAEGSAEFSDAQKRDQQRLADVASLQKALQAHFDAKQSYPDTIEGLVPDYIAALPKNPTPGGIDYSYTPIGKLPATFYDLSYALEVGAKDADGNDVAVGDHTATPKGIAQP